MSEQALLLAAQQAGIITHFVDIHGEERTIAPDVLKALLAVMHKMPGEESVSPPTSPVPPVWVLTQGQNPTLPDTLPASAHWHLQLETGEQQTGTLAHQPPYRLPTELPTGYHQLTISHASHTHACRLIVAPSRCYQPAALLAGKKWWGACIQLYTLRSEHNWGIGDFQDLARFVAWIAQQGGAFVGLNPIHALYPALPEWASPYSPSSRHWLNILYIAVPEVPEFQQSTAAQSWWQQAEIQNQCQLARTVPLVDYSLVTQLKLTALRLAYQYFTELDKDAPRQRAFVQFCEDGGESLRYHAAFEVLQQQHAQTDKAANWLDWPIADRQSPQHVLQRLEQEHPEELRFFAWLQWLAHQQLHDCYHVGQQHNMPIGLYRDLAVGAARSSSTTWSDRSLYRMGASVGAPPDPLGPQGQNWNLPPMDPHELRQRGYQPFIDLLRANMQACGALRIDHVMALQRLWWIPAAEDASQGAYITYPVADLLAILALESQRHRCMVIGEDLGTVPDDMRKRLSEAGIYTYKVLYFEHDDLWSFRLPADYPEQAMATLTTHDLPTLYGFWQEEDLRLGELLGLYSPQTKQRQRMSQERALAKQGLLNALYRHKALPRSTKLLAEHQQMTPELNQALQGFLSDSAAALIGLQPEDWLGMFSPVNIPGTDREYPNWRRKLSQSLEEMQRSKDQEGIMNTLKTRHYTVE